jgi:hypothetical protein
MHRLSNLVRSLPLVAVFGVACSSQPAAPAATPAAPPAPPYRTDATVKDLMLFMIDPAADQVWQAVMTVESAKGTVDTQPRNEEEWNVARRGAITLMEASNLLMIPGRHVGRPGDKSEAPGVELEPAEMEANIAKDLPEFHKAALLLHKAAGDALAAINAKDPQKLFEVGEEVERACEHCHSRYWYPNEEIPVFPSAATETTGK